MSYLKPAALSLFILFAAQSDVSVAQNDTVNDEIVQVLDQVVPGVTVELMDGNSACSCPKFKCGKVPTSGCETSCNAPAVAKCQCGSCQDYYRENSCGCVQ